MALIDNPPRWLKGLLLLGAIAVAWKAERRKGSQEVPASESLDALYRRLDEERATPSYPLPAGAVGAQPYRSWAWWKRVLLNTYEEINRDRLLAVAAGVVFYALLAIFPAISAFVSFYGLFASPATLNEHMSLLAGVLPSGALDVIQEQVTRISAKDGKLSVAAIGGLLLALWSANAGIKAMIDALNVAEGVSEERSFIRLNAMSLMFTLGALVFLLLAVGAVVAFPIVMSTFGLKSITDTTTWLLRWPILLAVTLLGLAVLYRFGPSRKIVRCSWISPGSLFAAFAWLAGSALLSLYLSNFADYNATYGSLGAAIGLMMWMWLSTIVVLVGAELDSEIDKQRSSAGNCDLTFAKQR